MMRSKRAPPPPPGGGSLRGLALRPAGAMSSLPRTAFNPYDQFRGDDDGDVLPAAQDDGWPPVNGVHGSSDGRSTPDVDYGAEDEEDVFMQSGRSSQPGDVRGMHYEERDPDHSASPRAWSEHLPDSDDLLTSSGGLRWPQASPSSGRGTDPSLDSAGSDSKPRLRRADDISKNSTDTLSDTYDDTAGRNDYHNTAEDSMYDDTVQDIYDDTGPKKTTAYGSNTADDTYDDTAAAQDTYDDTAATQDTYDDTAAAQDTYDDTAAAQDTYDDTAAAQDTYDDTAAAQDTYDDTAARETRDDNDEQDHATSREPAEPPQEERYASTLPAPAADPGPLVRRGSSRRLPAPTGGASFKRESHVYEDIGAAAAAARRMPAWTGDQSPEPESPREAGREAGRPEPIQILHQFEEYLEVMAPLTVAEEESLQRQSVQDKWNILFNLKERECLYPATYYVLNLQKHFGPARKKMSLRRMAKEGVAPLPSLLRKLKLDLHMSHDSFVTEFVTVHSGVRLLVSVLREIQADQKAAQAVKKGKGHDLYKQCLMDEFDCLVCIKLVIKNKAGLASLLSDPRGGVESVSAALISDFSKTRVVTIQILTVVAGEEAGFPLVDEAFTSLRLRQSEAVRFKHLVSMLMSSQHVHFQTVCVRLFNTLWRAIQSADAKVYLQQELRMAGFEPDDLDRYGMNGSGPEFDEFQTELDVWRKNCINVSTARQELLDLENRNKYLRDEIDRLAQKIQEKTASEARLEQLTSDLQQERDMYYEKAAEAQDRINTLKQHQSAERSSATSQDPPGAAPAYDDGLEAKYERPRLVRPEAPPVEEAHTTASAPPAPPPAFLSRTVRRKVEHGHLPLINWSPMYSVERTVFEDLDDEAKLREIDFTRFEELFKLQTPGESASVRARRARIMSRSAQDDQLRFLDPNRAKNMIITKKRTNLTALQICSAIEDCKIVPCGDDTDDFLRPPLSGESAELLSKYTPTKDEMKQLAAHAGEYERMGEAEQFLFRLARIDLLDRKLAAMAFMGGLQETLNKLTPEIASVEEASKSVLNSQKLRGMFELILAFGNFLNSSKRGYALGFRLDSLAKLSEVRATADRSLTLLHYLAEVAETQYPDLLSLDTELSLNVSKGVSYQAMASDIIQLRQGLDTVKFLQSKGASNPNIDSFAGWAGAAVARVAADFHQMEEEYVSVCALLGENYRQTEPDALFQTLADFVNAFKAAVQENEPRLHPERAREKTAAPRDGGYPLSPGVRDVSRPSREDIALRDSVAQQAAMVAQIKLKSPKKRPAPVAPPGDVSENLNTPSKSLTKVGSKIMMFEGEIEAVPDEPDEAAVTEAAEGGFAGFVLGEEEVLRKYSVQVIGDDPGDLGGDGDLDDSYYHPDMNISDSTSLSDIVNGDDDDIEDGEEVKLGNSYSTFYAAAATSTPRDPPPARQRPPTGTNSSIRSSKRVAPLPPPPAASSSNAASECGDSAGSVGSAAPDSGSGNVSLTSQL